MWISTNLVTDKIEIGKNIKHQCYRINNKAINGVTTQIIKAIKRQIIKLCSILFTLDISKLKIDNTIQKIEICDILRQ